MYERRMVGSAQARDKVVRFDATLSEEFGVGEPAQLTLARAERRPPCSTLWRLLRHCLEPILGSSVTRHHAEVVGVSMFEMARAGALMVAAAQARRGRATKYLSQVEKPRRDGLEIRGSLLDDIIDRVKRTLANSSALRASPHGGMSAALQWTAPLAPGRGVRIWVCPDFFLCCALIHAKNFTLASTPGHSSRVL